MGLSNRIRRDVTGECQTQTDDDTSPPQELVDRYLGARQSLKALTVAPYVLPEYDEYVDSEIRAIAQELHPVVTSLQALGFIPVALSEDSCDTKSEEGYELLYQLELDPDYRAGRPRAHILLSASFDHPDECELHVSVPGRNDLSMKVFVRPDQVPVYLQSLFVRLRLQQAELPL